MMKLSKKIAALALSALFVLGSFSALAACTDDNPGSGTEGEQPEKTVSSIAVTTPPSKTVYTEGESFDKTGMVVTATYSDNTTQAVTDYKVDKTVLAVGYTAVTITYEGKTCTQAITVNAKEEERVVKVTFTEPDTGAYLNLYDNGKLYIMEGTDSETAFDWELGDDGLISVDAGAMSAYVSFTVYKSNGYVYLGVDQSMGGGLVTYSCSITDYYEAFGLKAQEVGRVTVGDDVLIVYDTGEYTMTLDGVTTDGTTNYTAAEGSSDKADLVLIPDGAESEEDYITAAVGQYDNIFTVADTFVIPNARLESWLGYTLAVFSGSDKGADMEYYFYDDGTMAFVIEKEGVITEIERKYMTFEYDNADLSNLSLTISTIAPTAGFATAYDGDEDEFTLTYTEKTLSWGDGGMTTVDGESYSMTIVGMDVDDALKNVVKEAEVLFELKADHGNKANGDEVSGENFTLTMQTDPESAAWDDLIDQMSYDDMATLVKDGGYGTKFISSINAPATVNLDGPSGVLSIAGISITFDEPTFSWPCEVVLAATWNTELAERMGEMVGEDALANSQNTNKIAGWYAPAMNIHRSAYSGRNFEYYSEDSFLSGVIGAAETKGATSKGLITFIKHFALNDQETGRTGGLMFANEQSVRELYLKPFEYAVRDGGSLGIMTSMNRIGVKWAGGHSGLMTETLRNEWGFKGVAVTDQASYSSFYYMDIKQGLSAGNDLWLNTDSTLWLDESQLGDYANNATLLNDMREASKHILYAVSRSLAMNGLSSSSEMVPANPLWKNWLIGADVALAVVAAGLTGIGVWRMVRFVRTGKQKG